MPGTPTQAIRALPGGSGSAQTVGMPSGTASFVSRTLYEPFLTSGMLATSRLPFCSTCPTNRSPPASR